MVPLDRLTPEQEKQVAALNEKRRAAGVWTIGEM
jgi:Spy/CpxP family protein refolding chaperone